jgi:hypothetical protein
MNKKLIIIGAILLCAILFIGLELIFFKTSSPDRAVLKFAKNMNKHCPTMVDFETRLDRVNAFADNTIHFDYTLIYHVKDSLHIDNLKKYMEPVILKKIKTSPTLSKYINKNLTWVYSYNDKKGNFIFKLTYTPDQFDNLNRIKRQ